MVYNPRTTNQNRNKVSLLCFYHKVIHSFRGKHMNTRQDPPRQQPSITTPLHHVNDLIQMSFFLIKWSNLLKKKKKKKGVVEESWPPGARRKRAAAPKAPWEMMNVILCPVQVKCNNALTTERKCRQRKFEPVLQEFDHFCEQLSGNLTYAWLFTLKSLLKLSQQTSDQPLLAVFDFFIRRFYSN